MSASARLCAAAATFAAWLVALFLGHAWGGAIHLLLALGIVLVPWREGRSPAAPGTQNDL